MGTPITKDYIATHDIQGRKLSPAASRVVTAFAQGLRVTGEKARGEEAKKKGKVPMLKNKKPC